MAMGYDPGAGQRFGVGVQTPGGALGFSLTPQEVVAARRRKLAETMGVNMPGVEQMDEKSILNLGVHKQQQDQENAFRQTELDTRMQVQQAKDMQNEQERAAKIEALKGLMTQKYGSKFSPLQIEQMIGSDPSRAAAMYYGDLDQEQTAAQKAVLEENRRKEMKAQSQAVLQSFTPEEQGIAGPMVEGMISEGGHPALVGKRVREIVDAKKKEAEVAEEGKKGAAIFSNDPHATEIYQAMIAGGAHPKQAIMATRDRLKSEAEAEKNQRDYEYKTKKDDRAHEIAYAQEAVRNANDMHNEQIAAYNRQVEAIKNNQAADDQTKAAEIAKIPVPSRDFVDQAMRTYQEALTRKDEQQSPQHPLAQAAAKTLTPEQAAELKEILQKVSPAARPAFAKRYLVEHGAAQ